MYKVYLDIKKLHGYTVQMSNVCVKESDSSKNNHMRVYVYSMPDPDQPGGFNWIGLFL